MEGTIQSGTYAEIEVFRNSRSKALYFLFLGRT